MGLLQRALATTTSALPIPYSLIVARAGSCLDLVMVVLVAGTAGTLCVRTALARPDRIAALSQLSFSGLPALWGPPESWESPPNHHPSPLRARDARLLGMVLVRAVVV